MSDSATVRVDGSRRVYSVDAEPMREIDEWLGRFRTFWTHKLDALGADVAPRQEGPETLGF